MKIVKRLLVDGQEYGLIEDDTRLALKSPGRASFTVKATQPLSGVVELLAGWQNTATDKPVRWFLGYVDRSSTVSSNVQLIFCRELAAALDRYLPLGLRKVSAKEVLARIARETALTFITNNPEQFNQPSPYFHHTGGGYQALDAIGEVYQMPNYIWQQQGNAKIYVGSWNHSRWAKPERKVSIPDNLFTQHMAHNTARIAMIPALRPGVQFNRGIITAIQLKQEHMVLTWKKPSNAFF